MPAYRPLKHTLFSAQDTDTTSSWRRVDAGTYVTLLNGDIDLDGGAVALLFSFESDGNPSHPVATLDTTKSEAVLLSDGYIAAQLSGSGGSADVDLVIARAE